jgi:hypothetical protein
MVYGLGFEVRLRAYSGFGASGFGFRVSSFEVRVSCFGYQVSSVRVLG